MTDFLGIKIIPADYGEWPPSLDFQGCFLPVLEALGPFCWLAHSFDSGPIDWYQAESQISASDLEGYFIELPGHSEGRNLGIQLLAAHSLPKLAPFFYQDNITLLSIDAATCHEASSCFLDHLSTEWMLSREAAVQRYRELVLRYCRHVFICNDGRSWEFFSQAGSLVTRIEHFLAGDGRLTFSRSILGHSLLTG